MENTGTDRVFREVFNQFHLLFGKVLMIAQYEILRQGLCGSDILSVFVKDGELAVLDRLLWQGRLLSLMEMPLVPADILLRGWVHGPLFLQNLPHCPVGIAFDHLSPENRSVIVFKSASSPPVRIRKHSVFTPEGDSS